MYTFFAFGNILNNLITLERLSNFIDRLKKLIKIRPYFNSFVLFLVCNIFHLPLYLFYTLKTDEEFNDALTNYNSAKNFQYCGVDPLFENLYTKITIFFLLLFRDIFTCILEIILNITTIRYWRKFLAKKSNLQNQAVKRKNESKLTVMTIYISFLTITASFVSIINSVMFFMATETYQRIQFLAVLTILIKNASTFILFIFMNIKFKEFFVKSNKISN